MWHRAYAAALGGILHQALADLEEIEQRRPERMRSEESVTDPAMRATLWSKLIKPYCLCDRDAIRQVGERNATLQPWATRLWFQVASCYRQPQWIYEAAGAVNENCPTAYGVYAEHGRLMEQLSCRDTVGGCLGTGSVLPFCPAEPQYDC